MIQTQTHTASGLSKAEKLVDQIRDLNSKKGKRNDHPVGLIEIRRVHNGQQDVKFRFIGYDLDTRDQMDLGGRDL